MKVTVFGATGLLGQALLREWRDDQVTGLGSKDADVRSEAQIREVMKRSQPEWVILAAAYTDVDGCETNRDLAFAVNNEGAVSVARVAKEFGPKVIFISTDYVFDGQKKTAYEIGDPRAPQSVYGASKAEAEKRILQILPDVCIVRTSWVFGIGGKCFPDTILKLAASRAAIDVVADQRGCPTYTVDLAKTISQLCHKNAKGIVHVTNSGDCTWFDFAREIVAGSGLPTKVNPTTSDKFVRPAMRPQYSVLSSESLKQYQITMPTWQDALQRYLAERKSN
jgi:dTDP-4-dehydrorhamnose reductase